MNGSAPRFYTQDLDSDTNVPDLLHCIADNRMIAIVDEDAGGIIAYAIDDENAKYIVAILEANHD